MAQKRKQANRAKAKQRRECPALLGLEQCAQILHDYFDRAIGNVIDVAEVAYGSYDNAFGIVQCMCG